MKQLIIRILLCVFATSSSLLASTISVLPTTKSVTTGQIFTLSIAISGVTDLYGYQFDIGFNPAVLAAISETEGSFLSAGGSTIFLPGLIDNVGGSITANGDILDSALSGVTGAGDLFDLTFKVLAAGSSNVNVFNVLALNSFGQGIDATPVSSLVTASNANTSPVPEPSTGILLATGALGFFATRKLRT